MFLYQEKKVAEVASTVRRVAPSGSGVGNAVEAIVQASDDAAWVPDRAVCLSWRVRQLTVVDQDTSVR